MLKDDWDEIEELGKVSARLEAEVARLTAERAAIGSNHHDAISAIRLENYTLRAEIDALRGRAERAERVSAVYRQASLIPMWNRWSVRLGRFDLMNTWSTEEAALSALDAALGLDAKPAGEGGTP
jgi:hypothetical protein